MADQLKYEYENANAIDESITEDDVILWGYDNLDDFWESNI